MTPFILTYLILINAGGFLLMLSDKIRAKRNRWRIREFTLLGVAGLGGSIGTLLGMYLFRHKTRHAAFAFGLPLMIIAQAFVCMFFLSLWY